MFKKTAFKKAHQIFQPVSLVICEEDLFEIGMEEISHAYAVIVQRYERSRPGGIGPHFSDGATNSITIKDSVNCSVVYKCTKALAEALI